MRFLILKHEFDSLNKEEQNYFLRLQLVKKKLSELEVETVAEESIEKFNKKVLIYQIKDLINKSQKFLGSKNELLSDSQLINAETNLNNHEDLKKGNEK